VYGRSEIETGHGEEASSANAGAASNVKRIDTRIEFIGPSIAQLMCQLDGKDR
jgi:hypothetical protein